MQVALPFKKKIISRFSSKASIFPSVQPILRYSKKWKIIKLYGLSLISSYFDQSVFLLFISL